MKLSIILIAATLLFFSSCRPDTPESNTGTLELVFKAEYNGTPLVMFQDNATGLTEPTQMNFSKLEFFVSDIKATLSGTEKTLKDVGYISLNGTTSLSKAEEGITLLIEDIPAGSYSDFNLGVGLSDEVNGTAPSDYTTDSPLGINGNYWENWVSYIMSKVEGTATKADASKSTFLYHSGVNGMHSIKSFNTNFDIKADGTTQIVIIVEASDIFFRTGNVIDLIAAPTTHSGPIGGKDYNVAIKSINNLAASMVIQ